jgi:hypothetical protein
MNPLTLRRMLVAFLVGALLMTGVLPNAAVAQEATPVVDAPLHQNDLEIVAAGLTNGRSFEWADDGTLYIATAGVGGDNPGTVEAPVVQIVGTLWGGKTATVSRIEDGCPVVVAPDLASTRDEGGVTVGAAAVSFLNGELYVLIAGGGEVHGNPDMPNGVYRIEDDGSATLVADLSAFIRANPVEGKEPDDYSPDGDPYAMEPDAASDALWLLEANSGQLLRAELDGTITRVVDFSEGDPVPTALTLAPQGGVYVGFLTHVPFEDGTSRVVHVTEEGEVTEVWTGLTMLTAVAVGPEGDLYGLSFSTGNQPDPPFFVPGTGKVIRQTGPDSHEDVVTDLNMPNYMAFGPDGDLYIGLPGIGATSGEGVILRLDMTGDAPATPAAPPVCEVATPVVESTPAPEASPFA